MSIRRNSISQPGQYMCLSCQTFYGSDAYQGYCSNCFKSIVCDLTKAETRQKEEISIKEIKSESQTSLSVMEEEILRVEERVKERTEDKKRCFNCNRKVGLLGIECKCGMTFCRVHRLPEEHACSYDFAEEGRKKLGMELVRVRKGKLEEI